jgi:hypothetical protein
VATAGSSVEWRRFGDTFDDGLGSTRIDVEAGAGARLPAADVVARDGASADAGTDGAEMTRELVMAGVVALDACGLSGTTCAAEDASVRAPGSSDPAGIDAGVGGAAGIEAAGAGAGCGSGVVAGAGAGLAVAGAGELL